MSAGDSGRQGAANVGGDVGSHTGARAADDTKDNDNNNARDNAKCAGPHPTAVAPGLRTFLAFDFGLKRTGVAVGNRMLRTATPQPTIQAQGDARFAAVAKRITEWQPDALVIGVPYYPDGASHDNTVRAQKFGRQLHGRFRLPVFEVDERYSTTEALSHGARDADAASACIILEQFLRGLD